MNTIDKKRPLEAGSSKGQINIGVSHYTDTWALCQSALLFIDASDRGTWLKVAMALKDEFGDAARELWEVWSQQADTYSANDASHVWRSIRGGSVRIATLFHLAQQNGWSHSQAVAQQGGLTHAQYMANAQRIEKARQAREREQLKRWEANKAMIKQAWEASAPLSGCDAASRYLTNRGLLAPATDALRCHDAIPYYHEGYLLGYYPALLGAVTDNQGELITLHRTFLTQRGAKADVPTVKKLTPTAAPMRGASIKLYAPECRTEGLSIGIAEGIETAIAAQMLFDVPVWAGISTSGLASFVPSSDIKSIYIFADNDENHAGQDVANKAAERLTRMGFVVRVLTPPDAGTDWADVVATRRPQ